MLADSRGEWWTLGDWVGRGESTSRLYAWTRSAILDKGQKRQAAGTRHALLLDVGKEGLARSADAFGSMCEDDVGVDAGQGVLGRPGEVLGRLVVRGHGRHEGHAATGGGERQGLVTECAVEKVEFAAELGGRE